MDTNAAPAGGADEIVSVPVSTPAESDNTPISATEAARQLANWRYKRDNPEPEPAPEQAAAEPEQNSAEADAAPPEEVPGETTEAAEPEAELPPIEPPRSWTKEEKEEFATYPREAQEKIARREQDRERALRQSQNEAAEKLKGLSAKEQQAEQARQKYEAALPQLLQTLQEQQAGEFADIKTMADVERLAREDWPRYALWDAQQKKIAAVAQEVNAAKDRQVQEFRSKWAEFASKEDAALLEKAPELADKTKQQKIADGAVAVLKDLGFSEKDLVAAWNGEQSVSLRDHRIQLLILDAMKYREAKAAKPAPKPVPQVLRPGTSKPQPSAKDSNIAALEKQFEQTGDWKIGAQLLNARRMAAR